MDDFIRRPKKPIVNLDEDEPVETSNDHEVVAIAAPLPVVAEPPKEAEPEEAPSGEPNADSEQPDEPKKKRRKKRGFKVPVPKTKLQWAIAIAVFVLLLGGAGGAVYWFILRDTAPVQVAQEPEPEPEPTPEPIYSIVSGRQINDAAINNRPIYAVQIENSPEARQQSGLVDADIVSELVAEGGITRFNAIYHDNIPANIGPIRSLRPYFIDMFLPYDAAIVHAGGSGEALSEIRSFGLKDMDESRVYMRRISSRYAPHNLYSTGKQLLDLSVDRGYKSTVSTPLPRKDSAPVATPDARVINVRIGNSSLYNVRYTWDAKTGSYLREQGGAAHTDADSKIQIAPNVVIVPIMRKGAHPDGVHTSYTTTGSGKVYVFQDGTVTEGTWTKSSRSAQWVLKDSAGNPISLNRGQTWFTVTDASGNVKYAP